jgi:ActR/RegA family two-component response regulator
MSAAPIVRYDFAWKNRVLLINGSEFRRSLRANIWRGHGFQVEVARDLAQARSLWRPNTYAWMLVDVLRQLPGEVLEFCEQIKHADPRQQIAFLVGPPRFVSLNWPEEATPEIERGEELRATARRLPRVA